MVGEVFAQPVSSQWQKYSNVSAYALRHINRFSITARIHKLVGWEGNVGKSFPNSVALLSIVIVLRGDSASKRQSDIVIS